MQNKWRFMISDRTICTVQKETYSVQLLFALYLFRSDDTFYLLYEDARIQDLLLLALPKKNILRLAPVDRRELPVTVGRFINLQPNRLGKLLKGSQAFARQKKGVRGLTIPFPGPFREWDCMLPM